MKSLTAKEISFTHLAPQSNKNINQSHPSKLWKNKTVIGKVDKGFYGEIYITHTLNTAGIGAGIDIREKFQRALEKKNNR